MFDATNTTRERRELLYRWSAHGQSQLLKPSGQCVVELFNTDDDTTISRRLKAGGSFDHYSQVLC